ncbi:MAG TPA: hypothetical protein VHD63_19640 [Ktedonobacteraceae bacterium]|nr:hypothetical protein [Ktedonobacteraceae bacterium]
MKKWFDWRNWSASIPRLIQPASAQMRRGLLTGFLGLLALLLVGGWITLAHRAYPASPSGAAASSAVVRVAPPRRDSSLVYDPLHHIVLLFGGSLLPNGGLTNETWSWNGSSWQQQHPLTSPPALPGSMVYDAASRQVILFLQGNAGGGQVANQMWTWDGSNWHRLQAGLMPDVLSPGLVYDAARGQVLLFGVEAPATSAPQRPQISATWTWNGSAWHRLYPLTSPAARTGAALAYDGTRQQVVLYGGVTAQGLSSETWTWNGSAWQELSTRQTPTPRQHGLLVYDSAARQLLLFGGLDAQGLQSVPGATWLLENTGWIRVNNAGAPTDLYASATYDDATRTVLVYTAHGSLSKDATPDTAPPVSQTWSWNGSAWKLLS